MSVIRKIDLATGNELNVLEGTYQVPFALTSFADDSSLILAAGRSEVIGDYLYRVEEGNFSVTDSAANGDAYLYLADLGDGTASAILTNDVPTFDPLRGGYYNGLSRAIMFCIKSTGPIYSYKMLLNVSSVELSGNIRAISLVLKNTASANTFLATSFKCDGSSAGSIPPIGSIIGIHPDVKETLGLDSSIWALCDGNTDLPTAYFYTTHDTKVPDLTDDIFLRGSSSYGVGGSHVYNLSHNHMWYYGYRTISNQGCVSYDSGGNIEDFVSTTNGSGGAVNSILSNATGNCIGGLDVINNAKRYYTNKSLSTTYNIRPKYFSVKYYMRIK